MEKYNENLSVKFWLLCELISFNPPETFLWIEQSQSMADWNILAKDRLFIGTDELSSIV